MVLRRNAMSKITCLLCFICLLINQIDITSCTVTERRSFLPLTHSRNIPARPATFHSWHPVAAHRKVSEKPVFSGHGRTPLVQRHSISERPKSEPSYQTRLTSERLVNIWDYDSGRTQLRADHEVQPISGGKHVKSETLHQNLFKLADKSSIARDFSAYPKDKYSSQLFSGPNQKTVGSFSSEEPTPAHRWNDPRSTSYRKQQLRNHATTFQKLSLQNEPPTEQVDEVDSHLSTSFLHLKPGIKSVTLPLAKPSKRSYHPTEPGTDSWLGVPEEYARWGQHSSKDIPEKQGKRGVSFEHNGNTFMYYKDTPKRYRRKAVSGIYNDGQSFNEFQADDNNSQAVGIEMRQRKDNNGLRRLQGQSPNVKLAARQNDRLHYTGGVQMQRREFQADDNNSQAVGIEMRQRKDSNGLRRLQGQSPNVKLAARPNDRLHYTGGVQMQRREFQADDNNSRAVGIEMRHRKGSNELRRPQGPSSSYVELAGPNDRLHYTCGVQIPRREFQADDNNSRAVGIEMRHRKDSNGMRRLQGPSSYVGLPGPSDRLHYTCGVQIPRREFQADDNNSRAVGIEMRQRKDSNGMRRLQGPSSYVGLVGPNDRLHYTGGVQVPRREFQADDNNRRAVGIEMSHRKDSNGMRRLQRPSSYVGLVGPSDRLQYTCGVQVPRREFQADDNNSRAVGIEMRHRKDSNGMRRLQGPSSYVEFGGPSDRLHYTGSVQIPRREFQADDNNSRAVGIEMRHRKDSNGMRRLQGPSSYVGLAARPNDRL